MIENGSLVLTALATLFAAIAAWFSYLVSRNSLRFQKSYARNQGLINNLNSVITKVRVLRTLMEDPGGISDEQFQSIEPLFSEIKADLQNLNDIGVIDFSSMKISRITSFGEMIDHMAKNNAYLSEVVDALEAALNDIFK